MKVCRLRFWCCAASLWMSFPVMAQVAAITAEPVTANQARVDLKPFLRRDAYEDIKISPTGEFYAATSTACGSHDPGGDPPLRS